MMSPPQARPPASEPTSPPVGSITHRRVTIALQVILLGALALAVWNQRWLLVASTAGILAVTLLPIALGRRFRVLIPPEWELLAIAFVFASLFLGEIRGYYTRYWWWDAFLHTWSGFLLGIVGFLLVHVLNEKDDIELHMKPGFVAFFAFMFAVGMGAIWEIFEFGMDQLFGLNMQKSGLIDTMADLIVDTIGAGVIALLGYGWLRTAGTNSFLERWIESFIRSNPGLFDRS